MKSILLATASILAFAGAAAADVTFGGDASLGFNLDEDDENDNGIVDSDECGGIDEDDGFDCEDGFFWEANLGVTASQELNNGLVAAASFTLNIADDDDGSDVDVDDDFLLSLTIPEAGGIFLGDTAFAAESHWDPAGEMLADDFSEQDGEIVLRGDVIYGGVEASASYVLADDEDDRPADEVDQLSIGAEATVGRFTMSLGYQEESDAVVAFEGNNPFNDEDSVAGVYDTDADDDFEIWEVFGISAGTTFGGADVQIAYATNLSLNDDSLGFEVSYPFGPVTLGAYYVLENDDDSDFDVGDDELDDTFGVSADYASGPLTVSAFYEFEDDQDTENTDGDLDDGIAEDDDFGVEVGYDTGTGIEVFAGWIDSTEGYIGVEYDLGNGAELIASYAEQDEEGAREYEEGFTVEASFEF